METGSTTTLQGASRWALAGLSLAMLMPSLATSTANAALPSLAHAFGVTFQTTQWIVLGYLLTVTALIAAAGRLGDILGRRRLFLNGMAIFAVGSLLSGIAPSVELLILARVVQGAGAATMMALTMAFVSDVVPTERTGSAMGLLGTMSAVGTTLGPALGGLLIASFGGGTIFLINIPLAALAMMIASRFLPKDGPRRASLPGFDFAGMGLLAVALTAYAMAMTLGRGHFGVLNAALLIAALAAISGFVAVEARASSPLIRLELFHDRLRVAGLSTSAIVSTVMMATLIVGPFYLTRVLGLGTASAGLALAVGPLVAALAGVPAGTLVDRLGTARATLGGLLGLAAGATVLSIVPPTFGLAGYLAPIVMMTAGYGLFQAANNTAIMAGTSSTERGIVSGVLSLSRNIGLVIGASAMGGVFAVGADVRDLANAGSNAVAAGMHAAFAVAAVLALAALLITLRTASGATESRTIESVSTS
jgi:MFS family permease